MSLRFLPSLARTERPLFLRGVETAMQEEFRIAHKIGVALRALEGFTDTVNFLVLEKTGAVSKRLTAIGTGIWLLPRVESVMPREAGFIVETSPAFGTHERFLAGVNPDVTDEVRTIREGFPAFRTGELFFFGVILLVLDKERVIPETSPTLGTKERHVPRVDLLVFEKLVVSSESFAALGTLEGLLPRVDFAVSHEFVLVHESDLALGTLEGFGDEVRVHSLVSAEVRAVAEGLSTVGTRVWLHSNVDALVSDVVGDFRERFPTFRT